MWISTLICKKQQKQNLFNQRRGKGFYDFNTPIQSIKIKNLTDSLLLLIYMLQQERNYFKDILNLLKEIAFHQIYMEQARKQLCKDENYDPHTAFKSMDYFKHNRVIAYELYSFFQLNRIESTIDQCQKIIKCLDKSLSYMDYESFEQITLPSDSKLRNLSKNRFNNVKIDVGSYSKLTFVKQHSAQTVALFLQKQLNFHRHVLSLKQQFCRKWGGDVYTLLQKLFKDHNSKTKQMISFAQFYQFSRLYGLIFNQNEFRFLWRRSKNHRETLEQMARIVSISHQEMSQLLLVNDFNTKQKYDLQKNVPITKARQNPVPSYKTSHWREHQKWQKQKKIKQIKHMQGLKQMKKYNMKYKFSCFQSAYDNYGLYSDLKNKNAEWIDKVQTMNDRQLGQAYKQITSKLSLHRFL